MKPVSEEEGAEVAKEIGAVYKECSAKTGVGVKEVFEAALRETLKGSWARKTRDCVIL